ncbi:UNVERIFIED_CONTAM: hypothetical protein Cloal_1382 [Acetivibrio alkalicellulosi]
MIINTGTTFAYKCSSCGTFQFNNISLFDLAIKKEIHFYCRCKGSSLVINRENPASYRITIPCIGCGLSHSYLLSAKEFIAQEIRVYNCPKTGMQQCFMGSDQAVRRRIDNLEKEFDDLITMFGYDNYFSNTQVMFDSLNIIHDIAERGNLFCECGNNDIELLLLSDKIYLRCNKCPGNKVIYASSNEHLKDNSLKKQILLLDEEHSSDIKVTEQLLIKRDGK